MKQSSRVLFVLAAVAALPGVALAGGDRERRPECVAAHDARHLPRYDTNRDGTLDRAERQALRQDRRQEALTRYDADRDGRLDETEWVKMRRDRVAEKFARLDRNRDGAISRTEASDPCSRLASRFDTVDQDRDGRITLSELGAVKMFGKHGKGRFRRHQQGPQGEPEPAIEPAPGAEPGAEL